jgi:DNA-binding beta-propeller fold protein YncE
MLSGKKLIVSILFLISSLPGFTQSGQAKSLYAITNFEDSTISAYKISGDQIQKQISANFPSSGCGPVGLALDPDSATLFVSYDCSSDLELINARTMTEIKKITAPAELAGLVFDQSKQKLYAVGMGNNKLFVY